MLSKIQNRVDNSKLRTQKLQVKNAQIFSSKSMDDSVSFGMSKPEATVSFADSIKKIWLTFIKMYQENTPKIVKQGDIITGKYEFKPEIRITAKDNSVVCLRGGKGMYDFEMDVLDSKHTPPYSLYHINSSEKDALKVSKMGETYVNTETVDSKKEISKVKGYIKEVLAAVKESRKLKSIQ